MLKRLFTGSMVLMLAVTPVSAQQLKFILGVAAGGPMDSYVRIIAEHMSKSLGRSYIVEAKSGNSSNLAAQYVASQPADGLTVMMSTQALMEINPHVFQHQRWSQSDFVPLIKGIEAPLVFVAHPSVPANSLDEFIAWAKSKSGTLSYASYNPGTPSHFLGALLSDTFDLKLAHVPYRGAAPQTIDLVAGHAQFGFTTVQSAMPYIEAGQMKALAVTSDKRYPKLAKVPTFAELGHPEFNAGLWFGLIARRDTPPALLAPLQKATIDAHADPKVREQLEAQGYIVTGQTGDALAKAISEGSARWEKLVRSTGFKATE